MKNLLALAMLAGSLVAATLSPAGAQTNDVLRQTHKDWEVRCIEGTDTCAMSQIGKTGDGQSALQITIQRISGAKTEQGAKIHAAMTVQTPLGVLIPYGVRLKIDNDEVVRFSLARCIPGGCVSRAPMLEEAVTKMKKGTKVVFGYFLDREVLVDVSLSGFTAAYNSLEEVPAQQ